MKKEQRRKTRMLAKAFSSAMASSRSFGDSISSTNPTTNSSTNSGVQMSECEWGKIERTRIPLPLILLAPNAAPSRRVAHKSLLKNYRVSSQSNRKEMHRGEKWTHIGELLYGNWQPSKCSDVVLVFCNKVGGIAFYGCDGFVGSEGLILQVFNLVDSFLNNITMCVREMDGWCHDCDFKE